MIELIQLRQFATIAKSKTLSAAAETLAISQSALSRSIQRLEEDFGAQVFDRVKNRLILNEAGKVALERAEKILSDVQAMQEEVVKLSKSARAVFIGTVAPGPIWVLQEHPPKEIAMRKIESELSSEEGVLEGLESGKYDFGVLPYSPESRGLSEKFHSEKICEERLFFSLPLAHPLAKRKSLRFSDMDGESFIVFSEIGFWDKIHSEGLPHSKFLVQSDKFTLEEITANSTLPHFVTDLSLRHFNRPMKDKAVIRIHDKNANAEFFLWKKR